MGLSLRSFRSFPSRCNRPKGFFLPIKERVLAPSSRRPPFLRRVRSAVVVIPSLHIEGIPLCVPKVSDSSSGLHQARLALPTLVGDLLPVENVGLSNCPFSPKTAVHTTCRPDSARTASPPPYRDRCFGRCACVCGVCSTFMPGMHTAYCCSLEKHSRNALERRYPKIYVDSLQRFTNHAIRFLSLSKLLLGWTPGVMYALHTKAQPAV